MNRAPFQVAVALGLTVVASASTLAFLAGSGPAHHRHFVARASQAGAAGGGDGSPAARGAQSPPADAPTPATALPTNAAVPQATAPTTAPATSSSPVPTQPTPPPVATPAPAVSQPPASPAHFGTLGPGASLPSGAQCAAWVHARPIAENKRMNRAANQVTGQTVGSTLMAGDVAAANQVIAPRIDGRFTGTTHEILRWAACKWGVDEDIVAAQAAVESWWRQTTLGDFGTDPTQCPPGHGLGVDGTPGQCPQSYGILQNRYPYEKSTWPGMGNSTAMNADTAYGIWRACFEGYEQWLNTVPRGSQYGAGDAWGCVGRWFSGRWHTSASDGYVVRVKSDLSGRTWETASFQEP